MIQMLVMIILRRYPFVSMTLNPNLRYKIHRVGRRPVALPFSARYKIRASDLFLKIQAGSRHLPEQIESIEHSK